MTDNFSFFTFSHIALSVLICSDAFSTAGRFLYFYVLFTIATRRRFLYNYTVGKKNLYADNRGSSGGRSVK